jgi:hypothetical protein
MAGRRARHVHSGDAGTCRYDRLRRHVTGGQELIRHADAGPAA